MLKFWNKKPATGASIEVGTDLADPVFAVAPAASGSPGNWRERLRDTALGRNLSALFSSNPKLDEALLEGLETTLLSADVGVAASSCLLDDLRKRLKAREFADGRALLAHLRAAMVAMLRPVERGLNIPDAPKPFVVLVVGVNGAGKTTTIGKLAKWLQNDGLKVTLAAGDTFRAAAVEQLKTWGERNLIEVIAQAQGADSAAVIYDALQAAQARESDVLIADTAGRLHTQTGLMDELAKIKRVLARIDPSAPHETLLVIDGTTGQNAVSQARLFHQAVGLTGLVVTKLDGSAKGGVVFALAREIGVPIRFVGTGEGIFDLRVFEAERFVDGVLPDATG